MGIFDFNANADAASPESYNAMALRQRIALEMLKQGGRKGYPRNLGEGLTAIGDALGERAQMDRLVGLQGRIDAAQEKGRSALPPAEDAPAPAPKTETPPAPDTAPPAPQSNANPPAAQPAADNSPAPAVSPYQVASMEDVPPPQQQAPPPQIPPVVPMPGTGTIGPSPADVQSAQNGVLSPRDRIAALVAGREVPQPNPTPSGGVLPPVTPSVVLGGPQPSVIPDIQKAPNDIVLSPGTQLAQARTKAVPPNVMPPPSQLPPGIKPTEAPAEPAQPTPSTGTAPPLPPMNARLRKAYELEPATQDPQLKQFYRDVITQEEKKRQDAYAPVLKTWETRLTREHEERQAVEEKKAIALRNRLGDMDPKSYEEILSNSRKQLAPMLTTMDAIRRARGLVPQMAHGLQGTDANMFLQRLMVQAGMPMNPKLPANEQFKSAMGTIAAQSRQMIVGPGSQSNQEMDKLDQVAAADTKLTPETINAALDAAERLNFKLAVQHQKMTRLRAGEDDPDARRAIYTVYGMPDMPNLVPQGAVDKLIQNSTNPDALKQFDNTFHTPGLAAEVLRLRRATPQR